MTTDRDFVMIEPRRPAPAGDPMLYLPDSFYEQHGIDPGDFLPAWARQQVHVLATRQDVEEFDRRAGGRSAKPRKPLIVAPDGVTPILIPGCGLLEVAELQELALGVLEKAEGRKRRHESILPVDEIRAEHGYVPREQFDATFRNALEDRMASHRRNSRTDPAPVRNDRPKGNQWSVPIAIGQKSEVQ